MRLRRAIALAATALVLLGACGGDNNPKLAKPKTTTTLSAGDRGPSISGEDDASDTAGGKDGNGSDRGGEDNRGGDQPSGDNGVDAEAYSDYGDYDNGRHAGQVKSFDGKSVGVDVVQFLTGEEAKEAYASDTGSSDGPDNDYYVRNQSKTVRNLPVDRDVVIRVNNTGGYPPSDPDEGHEVSVGTFQAYFDEGKTAQAIFWFTIKDGVVISIEEQYLP